MVSFRSILKHFYSGILVVALLLFSKTTNSQMSDRHPIYASRQLAKQEDPTTNKYMDKTSTASAVNWGRNNTNDPNILPTIANVHYGTHERQVLDFYKADSDKSTPLVIWIHGGGWVSGDKKNVHGLESYLDAGISVVSINYRYSWQAQLAGVMPPVKWPLEDAVRALQFVRSKAKEWNIDKERIAASGSSAGASSSLYLAFHNDMADLNSSDPVARESTRLWCAGVRHPQTSLDPQQMIEWTPNSKYGGHAFGFMDPNDLKSRDKSFAEFLEKRDSILSWIKLYSPYEHVSKDDPPIYMLYRSAPAIGQEQKDPTHTANFGLKLQEHCEELGVDCELVYPEKPNVMHEDFPEFIIEKLTE